MKIQKGNHIYKGMFWNWILWQCYIPSSNYNLFLVTIVYLIQHKEIKLQIGGIDE